MIVTPQRWCDKKNLKIFDKYQHNIDSAVSFTLRSSTHSFFQGRIMNITAGQKSRDTLYSKNPTPRHYSVSLFFLLLKPNSGLNNWCMTIQYSIPMSCRQPIHVSFHLANTSSEILKPNIWLQRSAVCSGHSFSLADARAGSKPSAVAIVLVNWCKSWLKAVCSGHSLS